MYWKPSSEICLGSDFATHGLRASPSSNISGLGCKIPFYGKSVFQSIPPLSSVLLQSGMSTAVLLKSTNFISKELWPCENVKLNKIGPMRWRKWQEIPICCFSLSLIRLLGKSLAGPHFESDTDGGGSPSIWLPMIWHLWSCGSWTKGPHSLRARGPLPLYFQVTPY